MKSHVRGTSLLLGLTFALCGTSVQAAPVLTFVSHGEYFAHATHADVAIDPEVFVQDSYAPATSGPGGIAHVAGIRPARLADDPSLPLFNAQGDALSLSLGRWIAAAGIAEMMPPGDDEQHVRLRFTNLVAFGIYSVFVVKVSPEGTSVRPLGDAGTTFTSSIDGFAEVTPALAAPLEPGDAIELVYHSDDTPHGDDRGNLGITAHEQLVVSLASDSAATAQADLAAPADPAAPATSAVDAPVPPRPPVDPGDDGPADAGPPDGPSPVPSPSAAPSTENEPVF